MIKKLNSIEFEHLLGFITKKSIFSEDDFKLFKDIALKAPNWPQGISKEIMIDFMATLEVTSFKTASRSFGLKAYNLSNLDIENKDAINLFNYNFEILSFQNLGLDLINNPENGYKILSAFKSQQKEENIWLDLSQRAKTILEKQITKAKEGDTRTIIKDFPKLSKAVGGFNPGRITIISAISGFGKTKLAINLALSIMQDNKTCLFANMEMTEDDFVGMIFQNKAKIENEYWQDGSFITNDNLELLNEVLNNLNTNLKYTDGKHLTSAKLINSIYEFKPDFIIIDYDQKIVLNKDDEWMAMLKTIEQLEDVSKQTNTHIILLAQGNEEGDIKSSKRAKQPASAVLSFMKDDINRTVIKSIKNRYGPHFILEVNYNPSISKIEELGFVKNELKKAEGVKNWADSIFKKN